MTEPQKPEDRPTEQPALPEPQPTQPTPARQGSHGEGSPRGPRGPEDRFGDGPPERHDVSNLHTPIMREKLDPKDGYEPVPIWLVSLFGIVLFWGGWYLATYSGGFRADVYDSDPAARYRVVAPTREPPSVDPMVLGREVYMAAGCSACHGPAGEGLANVNPPLAGSEWVLGEPAHLKRIMLHGMDTDRYPTVMPPFARQSDERLAAVMTYIRNDWGNSASHITPASVTATREATAGHTAPWSESALRAITEDDLPEEEGAAGEALEADGEEEE